MFQERGRCYTAILLDEAGSAERERHVLHELFDLPPVQDLSGACVHWRTSSASVVSRMLPNGGADDDVEAVLVV